MNPLMKLKIFFLILHSLFFILHSSAQQMPTYSQNILNPYLLNPAYAGESSYMNVFLHARNEFSDMPNSPESYMLTMDGNFSNPKFAFGVSAFNNIEAIFKNMGISASYRYKLQIADIHFVSLAISGGIVQNSIDFSKIIAADPTEISDFKGVETRFNPNIDFGILYQLKNFRAGFSIHNLTSPTYKYEQTQNEQYLSYRLMRSLRFTLAYEQPLYEELRLDAMLLSQSVQGLPFEVGASANFNYGDKFWIGGGYRLETDAFVMAGIRVSDQLMFSYCYNFIASGDAAHRAYLGATHEVALGFRWQRQSGKNKSKDKNLNEDIKQLRYMLESQGEEIDRLKQENEEIKRKQELYSIDNSKIDSLIALRAHRINTIPDVKVMEENAKDSTPQAYYVIVAAGQDLLGFKDFQKLLLRELSLETSLMPFEGNSTYYFLYTGHFVKPEDAQAEVKRLRKMKINNYIIGEVWVYKK